MPQQGSHRRRPPASVAAACEMAQSAIQAVENLEHAYGIPAGKMAVTR
jgi:hypothetical protein